MGRLIVMMQNYFPAKDMVFYDESAAVNVPKVEGRMLD
jgi:hypothetical protein